MSILIMHMHPGATEGNPIDRARDLITRATSKMNLLAPLPGAFAAIPSHDVSREKEFEIDDDASMMLETEIGDSYNEL